MFEGIFTSVAIKAHKILIKRGGSSSLTEVSAVKALVFVLSKNLSFYFHLCRENVKRPRRQEDATAK